jgi:hypothetical protein
MEDPLRQNPGRQAAVINAVREARAEYDDHLGKVERVGVGRSRVVVG